MASDTMNPADNRSGIPEFFCITAPHRRERFDWEGKLSTVLFYGDASSLVWLLAKPAILENDGIDVNIESKSNTGTLQRVPILEMPHEIYGGIFEFLDDQSLFNLGLTCQELWPLAKYFLKKRYQKFIGTWAGTPLICPGCNHPKGESNYPPGALNQFAIEELRTGLSVGETSNHDSLFHIPGYEEVIRQTYKTNLFRLAIRRYKMLPLASDSLKSLISLEGLESQHEPKDMALVARPTPELFYPMNEPWVLRNLTTRQFVSAEKIALKPAYVHGPLVKILGFPEVVIFKTCWSELSNTWVNYPINMGPWAGHSFDIIPISRLEDDGTWEDISLQIAGELREMCRAQYGDGWEGELVHRFDRMYMDPWGSWKKETLWQTIQRQAIESTLGFLDFFKGGA